MTGIETQVPVAEAAAETLRAACKDAALVIMTAELACQVPALELEAALTAEVPALAIIPDVLMCVPPPDLAKRLRRALGIEE